MNQVYIVDGLRTPIGKTGGVFKDLLPEIMGAQLLQELITRHSLDAGTIDSVMLGNATGPGGNLSRVTLLEAGFPFSVPGITIDFQCGSGMSAILLAAAQIASGQADLIIAGGVESTSLAPKRQFQNHDPRYNEERPFYDRAPFAPLSIGDPDMGQGAENLAEACRISRESMDLLALQSHQKAVEAVNNGILDSWMMPVRTDKGVISRDETVRENLSEKLLKRMPGAFVKGGLVTAGNSCLTHDGAAVVLLASEKALKEYQLRPAARYVAGLHAATDPNQFPLAPVEVINRLARKTGLKMEDVEAIEINEAFAVKILACCQKLGIPLEKVNQLGGALAYGHPYGASGTIITIHLLALLQEKKYRYGMAAIGVGGGTGAGLLLERC